MNETLFIPKKIKVGFNHRVDTYTKKLAYVIYWDDKGKLRKEKSWSDWIQKPNTEISFYNQEIKKWDKKKLDESFEPKDFDNVPMSGFVLNKGVGGARESWGWNARNEYIRVFDPRGFEFEISVVNLLFILTECISSKGKGLEGEFVYSWAGKELVLLPVDSLEYKESKKYTDLQAQKITKTDIVPGRVYQFKNKTVATYLGRLPYHDFDLYTFPESKLKHVFKTQNGKYIAESGFTKLALIVNENVDDTYADMLQEYQDSKWYNPKIKEIFIDHVNKRPEFIEAINNDYIEYINGGYFNTSVVSYIMRNNDILKISINNYDKSIERIQKMQLIDGKLNSIEIYKQNYYKSINNLSVLATNVLSQLNIKYTLSTKYNRNGENVIVDSNDLNKLLIKHELYVVLESGTIYPVSDYIKYF